jgi:glyoxylase-like metal-dependent hydrolase (beta-lactamase superfamily II)
MLGTVRVHTWGDVKTHTYISPEDGLLANTQIVEGLTKLIIFDAQYFLTYAAEAAAYASSLNKPVERIVVSHVHLDHWSGLPVLSAQFPAAPICAPRGVAEYLLAHGQKILDARRPVFGDRIHCGQPSPRMFCGRARKRSTASVLSSCALSMPSQRCSLSPSCQTSAAFSLLT